MSSVSSDATIRKRQRRKKTKQHNQQLSDYTLWIVAEISNATVQKTLKQRKTIVSASSQAVAITRFFRQSNPPIYENPEKLHWRYCCYIIYDARENKWSGSVRFRTNTRAVIAADREKRQLFARHCLPIFMNWKDDFPQEIIEKLQTTNLPSSTPSSFSFPSIKSLQKFVERFMHEKGQPLSDTQSEVIQQALHAFFEQSGKNKQK